MRETQGSNAAQIWELIKFNIAQFCQEQTVKIAAEKRKELIDLEEKLAKIIDEKSVSLEDNTLEHVEITKKIEEYYDNKTKESIFRCKARWYGEGERNSKYYFNLEKARYKSRMMVCLVRPDGSMSRKQKEILQIQASYYK